MKHRLSRRRVRGASLLEMIVVIFAMSLALGLVGKSLSSLARVNARFDKLTTERSDLDHLMQRLRLDIHSAQAATLDDTTLNLAISGSEDIAYVVAVGQAERITGGVTTRFRLPARCRWTISDASLDTDNLLEITFLSDTEPPSDTKVIFGSLIAEVNREAHLSLSEGNQ